MKTFYIFLGMIIIGFILLLLVQPIKIIPNFWGLIGIFLVGFGIIGTCESSKDVKI